MFLREIILGYSRGESVRSICMRLGSGDRGRMLRYQNKYRAILQNDGALIDQTLKNLSEEGYLVKNPLRTPLRASYPAQSLRNNIIEMPAPDYNSLTDQDITNLFMGVVRLVRKQGQSQIDKLKNEIEQLTAKPQGRRKTGSSI